MIPMDLYTTNPSPYGSSTALRQVAETQNQLVYCWWEFPTEASGASVGTNIADLFSNGAHVPVYDQLWAGHFWLSDGGFQVCMYITNGGFYLSPEACAGLRIVGEFHHYAVAVDLATQTITGYRDGELFGSLGSVPPNATTFVRVAVSTFANFGNPSAPRVNNAYLTDARCYQRALAATEIREIFLAQGGDRVVRARVRNHLSGVAGELPNGTFDIRRTSNQCNWDGGYFFNATTSPFGPARDMSLRTRRRR